MALSVCLSVCLLQVGVSSIKAAERIELVFGTNYLRLILRFIVLGGNSGISRYKGTSLSKIVPNSGLREILQLHVDRRKCSQLMFRPTCKIKLK